MKKIFRDYMEIQLNERLEGFRISKVTQGINGEDTGVLIELEREITNGIIGIDICYDPAIEEIPFTVSDEYIKHVFNRGNKHD